MDAEFYAELWRELALDGIEADHLGPYFNLASTAAWSRVVGRRRYEMLKAAIESGAIRDGSITIPSDASGSGGGNLRYEQGAPPRLSLWNRAKRWALSLLKRRFA